MADLLLSGSQAQSITDWVMGLRLDRSDSVGRESLLAMLNGLPAMDLPDSESTEIESTTQTRTLGRRF